MIRYIAVNKMKTTKKLPERITVSEKQNCQIHNILGEKKLISHFI